MEKYSEFEKKALELYKDILNQKISHGKAAEILDIRKNELIDLYGRMGFSYYDLIMDELEEDVENCKQIIQRRSMTQNTIFHVHTYRCRHASNEKEIDYIKKAIELGAQEIVFTDHAPFPDNPFRFRMSMSELDDYIKTLNTLKAEYSEKINVRIGLEIEFIPTYMDYYKELIDVWNLDILLLGEHFALLPDGRYNFELTDKSDEAKILAEGMIAGMETGLFPVVAHPDQIFRRIKKWNSETEKISREIIDCAVRNGIKLERNISNMFDKNKYKYRPEFWKEAPCKLQTIYGVDAHSVEEMERNYLHIKDLQD